jgi:deoxyribodipyrimidine photo-lyase
LADLADALEARGGRLVLRRGEAVAALDRLATEWPVAALWSHEETGNLVTYRRDQRVARWAADRGIVWHEFRQDGVIRRLKNRDGWAARWTRFMNRPVVPAPPHLVSPAVRSVGLLEAAALGLPASDKLDAQRGGLREAVAVRDSFLRTRGVTYRADMASPVAGWDGCSRLSPYLAFGCISLRSVYQATETRRAELREMIRSGEAPDRRWFGSLASFGSRLRWHCHFMQKLEDEPRIEHENFSRACDGLREDFFTTPEAQERFWRWQEGRTGYPMVDACMRAVRATGWLNFRMRAMVVSFAAYHLWLHWREPAVFLARHFLDFEPGIHFSQFQMQSGTTGINTLRIYSPAKQVVDQDPTGIFVRHWVPELAGVPDSWLPEPHRMPVDLQDRVGCRIGRDYPAPVVDHTRAVAEAKNRLYAARRAPEARAEARRVLQKHGSRKRPSART